MRPEEFAASKAEFLAALTSAVDDHTERRANTADHVELVYRGWGRWEYRFYWGRYMTERGGASGWYDYETGVRFTRQWTLVAAAVHLTGLQRKDARKWRNQ